MNTRILQAKNLCKHYISNGKALSVINNISLSLNEGEIISIIGPSGCGKSTLLRILSKVEKPDSGFIEYLKDTQAPLVPQSPALLPWLTTIENIEIGIKNQGINDYSGNVRNLTANLGLGGFENYLPNNLSGGMRSRVSLARALVYANKLVLLDEAFSTLDDLTREQTLLLFTKIIADKRIAACIVSHDISEAVFLSDRVIVLTPRPISIAKEFDINFNRPRNSSLRSETEFISKTEEIKEFARSAWETTNHIS